MNSALHRSAITDAAFQLTGNVLYYNQPEPLNPTTHKGLGVKRIEKDWLSLVDTIQNGAKAAAEIARKSLSDSLVASLPVFKASKFFLNSEMSVADVALAPMVWRLNVLGVVLPREAHSVIEYGERIFRNPAFAKSMTESEKNMRAMP